MTCSILKCDEFASEIASMSDPKLRTKEISGQGPITDHWQPGRWPCAVGVCVRIEVNNESTNVDPMMPESVQPPLHHDFIVSMQKILFGMYSSLIHVIQALMLLRYA
jgi:hypothetical protein